MTIKIFPSAVNGSLAAPASKSVMQRALAAALLHTGITEISNPGKSEDDIAALNIITALGASASYHGDTLVITSPGQANGFLQKEQTISCGESGLAARMFTPIAAMADTPITLTASGSLQQRSMELFETILPKLGVDIKTTNGKFPMETRGPLAPKDIRVDGSLSSQFLTGLLFAYGACATEPVTIFVDDLKSRPYIDLTIKMMSYFGFIVTRKNYAQFTVYPSIQKGETIAIAIEGDWSSAAFLLVAGAIAGKMKITGLNTHSVQADKAIIGVLKDCGAGIEINNDRVIVYKNELKAFRFDATDCPDLFPPLVVLAAYCKGSSVIKGVSRLAGKESDRAKTLQEVFVKMGINISVEGEDMTIEGGNLNGATVSSHNDHRIAMAAAVAALGASGPVIIEHADAVKKSYPGFFRDLEMAGATTEGINT